MNLEQAVPTSCRCVAYRVIDDRRVIVENRQEMLIVQIQQRPKKRWIADDNSGGIRYLLGILRDGSGRYLCSPGDLTKIACIRAYLPLHFQALLVPECDVWQVME